MATNKHTEERMTFQLLMLAYEFCLKKTVMLSRKSHLLLAEWLLQLSWQQIQWQQLLASMDN